MSLMNDVLMEREKDGTKVNVWFFLKILVGTILLVKAGDGLFPIFARTNYGPEAQELFNNLGSLPSVNIAITTLHFIVGGFILWNTLVPLFVAIAFPIFLFATFFEFAYGMAILPQLLAIFGLLSCAALIYHYRGRFTQVFVKN
jgi:hypothetical protein